MDQLDAKKSILQANEDPYRQIDYLQAQVKRLETELERREGKASTCMENCSSLKSLHDGLLRFVKLDGSIRCTFGNEKIQKMLGYELHDLIGRKLTWFFHPKREIHRKVDLFIEEKSKGVTLETAFRTSYGPPVPVLCSIKPTIDENKANTSEYIVLVIDIRALKSAQEQTKSILHAERISTLGHLAASIAHEINNPLSFLLMDLDRQKGLYEKLNFIQNKMDDFISDNKIEEGKPQVANDPYQLLNQSREILVELDDIIQASNDGLKRISDVVKAVKTFGKTDYGNEKNEKIHIEEAIDVAQKLINTKIRKSNIKLEKFYEETPPIKANIGRLVQVVLNLVLNSIQAIDHDNGKVIIRTFNFDTNTIGFEVEDNGKGISEDNMKRIFEPYFTTKSDGTGLGLGIINNIIHELGGRITVKSEIDKGTIFTIYIPIIERQKSVSLISKKVES